MSENIKTTKELARYYRSQDIPLWVHGSPGIGKSQAIRQLTYELRIGFIDVRLGSLMPEDLSGIPVPDMIKRLAIWLESEFWPNHERDGEEGIIIFDEISDASRALQSAAYKIILERQHLPPGWWPCAAGNRREDRAAAGAISTALANRFAHVEVEADLECTIEYFNAIGVNELITGFLRFRPGLLHSMEGANLLAFPTPRSWEQAGKVCDAPHGLRFKLMRGLVGEGPAGEFEAYAKVSDLPDLDDIVDNPAKTRIPSEPGTKYALSSMLARRAIRSNFDKICTYIKREEFGRDFEICTVLDATKRDDSLCETKAFVEFAKRNSDLQL